MSISSKFLFPVTYNSRESDTCYSAVYKRLLLLFCSERQPGQKFLLFLYLNINYVLFDELLSAKQKQPFICIYHYALPRSAHNLQKFYVPQVNFIQNKIAMFKDLSGQRQYQYFWSTVNFSTV